MFPSTAARCKWKSNCLGTAWNAPHPSLLHEILASDTNWLMPHAQLHSFLWSSWNPQLYKQGHRNTEKCCFIYLPPQSITHVRLFPAPSLSRSAPQLLLCSPPHLCWYWVQLCDTKLECGLAASLKKWIKPIFEGSWEQGATFLNLLKWNRNCCQRWHCQEFPASSQPRVFPTNLLEVSSPLTGHHTETGIFEAEIGRDLSNTHK